MQTIVGTKNTEKLLVKQILGKILTEILINLKILSNHPYCMNPINP